MKKILAVSLIFFSVALSIIALAAPAGRSTLKGSKPSWAAPQNYVGAANASDRVGFRVYLGWNNPSGAEALAKAVSDPRSKSYRKYLTPAQFRSQFAPTQSQVAAVQSWLQSQGFTLVYTPQNNHYVSAQGSVGQAQAAFGASFGKYNVKALGLTLRSPSADVSIPSSLASLVTGVAGLDQSYEFIRPTHSVGNDAPPSAGFRNSDPFSDFWGQLTSPYKYPTGFGPAGGSNPTYAPWNVIGHTPQQIKGAYGITGPQDGTGQTVAIIDAYASPTILQDVNQWSFNRGLPQFNQNCGGTPCTAGGATFTQVVSPGIYNVKDNRAQSPTGWYGEETLDIEAVHGMAPNANIVYVGAPNNYQDLDAAMNHVVDNHLAQIVSNSYGFHLDLGLPLGYIKPLNDTLIQAAIEGIGVYFASGDSGDETSVLGYASTDWPASSPWVTAVGGTALGVGPSPSYTRLVETGWGQRTFRSCNMTTGVCSTSSFGGGGGGGVSCLFSQPSYQSGAGVPAAGAGTLCEGFAGRGVPDVAALGMPTTGYIVGQTQTFPNGAYYDEYRLGGTSLSCPIVAGIMALSDQKAGAAHGFANPFFYGVSGSGGPPSFYDVGSHKTAIARRDFNNSVDATNGTTDSVRTCDDYDGSPTQFTDTGWDNVTGLGVFNNIP
jgi:subtilase family serine protease